MENKAKIGFLILLIFYIILAESEMWGPVIITGDTPAEAILKLSNTPAAVSAESVLVKRYDSTVSNYPINNIKTTKIQWDSVTSKPTAYNPVLHQHDSIYYRETEVNNLLSSKSDTSHTHPQYKINGLVDTITNHRNAIASKFATADTNKLAQKSHIHVISNVTGLQAALDSKQSTISAGTTGQFYAWDKTMKAVDWTYVANKPSSFTPSAHDHDSVYAKLSLGTIMSSGGFATSLETDRIVFSPGIYSYCFRNTAENRPDTMSYGSVLTWGAGIQGAGQLAVGWATGEHNILMFRSLRDFGTPWWNWKRIYHTGFKPSPSDIGAAPVIHNHPWAEITGKPSTFTPSAHTHPWSEITGKPSTFTPSAHGHAWSEITGKPSSIAYKNEFNVFTAPSGISIDDVTAEADGTSTTNWNVVSHIQLVSNNNKMAFFLGSPQNERKAFIQVGHASSAYAPYLGELRLNPFGGNVTVNGYGVWHSGNFDPDNYQSAITGTANKVLSIQADGSGVKTGSIYDDGNVALIGKTTATPGFGYKLEVEGDAFINGDLLLNAITAYGKLNLRNDILLLNKAGNGWLSFVTRDVSGSEAVADLSNVGKISMISPSTNNTMELYVDSSRSAAGINAKTGLLEIRNTSTATNGDILIQSVTSDINISSQGESGEISLDAKRVKISRRNLKSQTFTYTVSGSYIIDLNNYYDVNLFIINNTSAWVSIGFKNATVGDEIHVNIKGYGAVAYQRDPNSENAWYEWPGDPIKLDEFFYKLICTGTDNYYGQTINTWIIGS